MFLIPCLISGFYEPEYFAWKVNYVISFAVLVFSANNKQYFPLASHFINIFFFKVIAQIINGCLIWLYQSKSHLQEVGTIHVISKSY